MKMFTIANSNGVYNGMIEDQYPLWYTLWPF